MSTDNFATLWVQQSVNENAMNRAQQAIAETGRALPCKVTAVSGSLVTVEFECTYTVYQNGQPIQATLPPLQLPRAESQWLRNPTQIGDLGMTVPADTFLGGVSGLGSGVADLSVPYGNMSTLVFVPVGSKNFSASPDANKAWVNGPNGAVLSDSTEAVSVTVDKGTGQVTAKAGSLTLILDTSTGTIQMAGSGMTSGNGVVRETDLQSAINAAIAVMVAWTNANFQAGANTAPAPTNPTVSASSKSFTA